MNQSIQTKNTSVIPVYSRSLQGGSTFIVYLSTTTTNGQLITIRDMDGYLSTPQSIRISTTNGVSLQGYTSSPTLLQKFSYMTLRSISTNTWQVVDTPALADPTLSYTLKGVSYSSLQVIGDARLSETISTQGTFQVKSITLASTLQSADGFYASSMTVRDYPRFLGVGGPFVEALDVGRGDIDITADINIQSTLSVAGRVVLGSAAGAGPLAVAGSLTLAGTLTMAAAANISSLSTGYTLSVLTTLSAGGAAVIQTTARTTRSLYVSSLFTAAYQVTTAANADVLQVAGGNLYVSRSDIPIVDPFYTSGGLTNPVVYTSTVTVAPTAYMDSANTSTAQTTMLAVIDSISSPGLSLANFGAASIQNANGSLIVSSVQTNSYTAATTVFPKEIRTSSIQASTFITAASLLTGALTAPSTFATALQANQIRTSSIGVPTFATAVLTVSSLYVSSSIQAPLLSSFVAPYATLLNTSGSILTSSISLANASLSNTLLRPQTLMSPTQSTFTFSTPLTTISIAAISTGFAPTGTLSSFAFTRLRLGTPLDYSTIGPSDPYITPSTVSGLSTNTLYEYVIGLGTTYQPLQIRASADRVVNLTFQNISTLSNAYFTANMTYRNNSSISGTAGLRIVNPGGTSTILSFNAATQESFQSLQLQNYKIEPYTAASTNSYFLSGPNTLRAPSTTSGLPAILAGGSGGSTRIALNSSGDAQTWVNATIPLDGSVRAIASDGTRWIAGGQGTADTLAYSYNGTTWYGLGNTVFTTNCTGIAWNGTLWVAVGSGTNTIAYSYDGLSWTGLGTSIFSTGGAGIAWNGIQWMATGRGTNTVAYSYNGLNWTGLGTAVITTSGNAVAYGNGRWVVVGSGANYFAYSTNAGATWTQVVISGVTFLQSVAWSGSAWLAGGASLVCTSADGVSWTRVNIANVGNIQAIAWTGTQWLIGGSFAAYKFATSPDGATWTVLSSAPTFTSVFAIGARRTLPIDVSGTDLLIGGSTSANLAYSLTGSAWQGLTGGSLFTRVNAVAYGFRQWVAVGAGTYKIAYSYDGVNWVGASTGIFSEGRGAAWTGFLWAAVGDATTDAIAYSYDGITWTGVTGTSLATSFRTIAWNHAAFFAYGMGTNTIATSPDGIAWTGGGAGTAPTECAAWNGSNWVGGANVSKNGNTLLTSADGITWTGQGATTFNTIVRSVAWNGSNWVAVGGSNAGIATSANGTVWTQRSTDLSGGSAVVWTGKSWVAGGFHSPTAKNIATSADGVAWSTFTVSQFVSSPVFANKTPLPYGASDSNVCIAVDSNVVDRLYTTSDGIHWRSTAVGYGNTQYTFANWNGRYWTLGYASYSALAVLNSTFQLSTQFVANFGMQYGRALAFGTENRAVVVGGGFGNGQGLSIDNGASYFTQGLNSTGSPNYFMSEPVAGVTFGNNLFVATGSGSDGNVGIRYSINGSNWSTPTTASSRGLSQGYDIQYHSSIFVAVGQGILQDSLGYSPDGSNWGWVSSLFTVGYGVCWGKDKWVAVGSGSNTIAYSADGSNWTGLGNSTFTTLGRKVAWNGNYFIATGNGGNGLAYSADGITWTGLGSSTISNGVFVTSRIVPPVEVPPVLSNVTIDLKVFNWSLTGITQITQQSVQKPSGGAAAWDSRAASQESYTATAYLSFQPAQTSAALMVGLSENPTATTSFTSLNFAFSLTTSGLLQIYELGTLIQTYGAYTTTDILRITYDGATVRYVQNDTVLRSVSRATGSALYLSSSFYTPGGQINAVDFHALYSLTGSAPAISTSAYVAETRSGTAVEQFAPFYLTLTSNLAPTQWTLSLSLDGTITSQTTSFYADIYINETKYYSTNIIQPAYTTSPSTYQLAFSNAAVQISTSVQLSARFRATRGAGNTFLYTGWSNAGGTDYRSSVAATNSYNPNSIQYLQFFHSNANSGLQTSELDIYVTAISTFSTTYMDTNVGLEFNRGYMRWPTTLNGTTIENRFNDTTTRSLTYTGAIYNASDPRAKEEIAAANEAVLFERFVAMPLYRYSLLPAYREKFRTQDEHQLGILATDLAVQFPRGINEGPNPFDTDERFQGFKMVDRAQLQFFHMAATKHLLRRISTLEAAIAAEMPV